MEKRNKNIAIIIAGGVGSRMGQSIPKQFLNVYDKPVLVYTMECFQKHPIIDAIIVVCLEGWCDVLKAYANQFNITKLVSVVSGGSTGFESIRNGVLEAKRLYNDEDIILIHDAIRPNLSSDIISNNIAICLEKGNAITAIPCHEAMLYTEDNISSDKVIDRNFLFRTQTPQTFFIKDLYNLHQEAIEKGITNSVASCTLMVELGKKVHFVSGSEKNIKLTTTDDIEIFKALLNSEKDTWLK